MSRYSDVVREYDVIGNMLLITLESISPHGMVIKGFFQEALNKTSE